MGRSVTIIPMKTNIFVYIVTGVVVIGGIFFGLRGDSVKDSQESQQTNSKQEEGVVSGSMRDLVALNKSLECKFTSDTEYSKTSGTVYVADGKVRGNFSVSVAALGGQSFEAFMIADQTDSYVWSSLTKDGFKTPIQKDVANQAGQEGIDYNQTLSYNCVPWAKDESLFIPPVTVTFKEVKK